MKKQFGKVVATSALIFSSLVYCLYPYEAQALFVGPFGGQILASIPCDDGVLILLGLPSPGFYMYVPGVTLSYLVAPPVIPTQWVLGVSVAPLVCFDGPVPIGVGNFIAYEGASTPTGI